MSKEFFDEIEKIKKHAHEIQMLEGSHPYVGDQYLEELVELGLDIEFVEQQMRGDLKKRFTAKNKVTKKKGK